MWLVEYFQLFLIIICGFLISNSIIYCKTFFKMKNKGISESLKSLQTKSLLQCAVTCGNTKGCEIFEYNPLSCSLGGVAQLSDNATGTHTWLLGHSDSTPTFESVVSCSKTTMKRKPQVPCLTKAYTLIRTGDLDGLKGFLDQNDSQVNCSIRAMSLLSFAAFRGRVEIFNLLLKMGTDFCAQNEKNGQNILHVAVRSGHMTVVKRVLDANMIGIDVKDTDGNTPLMIAASQGRSKILHLLYENGGDIKTVDKHGRNILFNAAFHNMRSTVQSILKMNISGMLNQKDDRGDTPVCWPVHHCSREIIEMFLKSGCDMTVITRGKSIEERLQKCHQYTTTREYELTVT